VGRINKIFQNMRSPNGSNWRAIVLSIFAASIFWLFQSLNKNYSTNLTYPIAFDFPVENYVIIDDLPDEVQINISGIGWNIFRKTFSFGLNPVRVHLESPATTPKIIGSALLANINDQLPQFQVNYVISDTLHLNIESKAVRKFGVYVDSLSLDLKDNFKITGAIAVRPDSVMLSGPQSIIEQLPANLPIRVGQQNIDESYDESINFEIRGYQQSLLDADPPGIDVQFEVAEFVTVSYNLKLAKLDSIDRGIYAYDSMVRVVYNLPRSAQAIVDKEEIIVVALPETLNMEDSTLQLFIQHYPEEISSIRLDSALTHLKIIYE
jgi:hypothetical protein